MKGGRSRLALAVLCALLGAAAVVALSAMGSDDRAPERLAGAPPIDYLPGSSREGAGGGRSQVSEADCSQWRRASPQQRRAVTDEVGAYFQRVTRGGGGHSLPPDKAYEGLDRACRNEWASAFKLWKVYERVLAFQYAP